MIYFFSDVHLGLGTREEYRHREDILLDFLAMIRHDCERLYIVGDLFDYWFEYKTVVPKYFFRTITALYNLRRDGIAIEYLMGNHDFGHHTFFRDELDIPIHTDDITTTLHGKSFYIAHGDGKAYNDTGYLILRAILRNRFAQTLYGVLHPDIGIGLASNTSKSSRSYTDRKEYGTRDGLLDFAEKKIGEGFDYVVMGHRHLAQMRQCGTGYYVNLGHWLSMPATYGLFDGNAMHLQQFPANAVKTNTFY